MHIKLAEKRYSNGLKAYLAFRWRIFDSELKFLIASTFLLQREE